MKITVNIQVWKVRSLSPALTSIESIAAGSIVVPSERRCVHTAWLCPPALLADSRHAQAPWWALEPASPEELAAEGTLCCGLLGLIFSRMYTDSRRLPFPLSACCIFGGGRGTLAGGVVLTAGIPAAARVLGTSCAKFLPQSFHQPFTMGSTGSQV